MSKRNWLISIGVTLTLIIALLMSGCAPGASPSFSGIISTQQEGIWVAGVGKVTVVPDIATLRLGIEAQETSVAVAQSQANEAMNKVMDALADNGVDEKDIQTQRFSIDRVTRWDDTKRQEIVIGFRVTNMVLAKIRDIDKTGTIIDAVAEAGGDLTRIDSIAFSVDDPSAYHEEAREKAMADAKDKAGQLAKLAGVKLGKPTYITESAQYPSSIYTRVTVETAIPAPAPAPTEISAGEMEITLTVQVAYAILN